MPENIVPNCDEPEIDVAGAVVCEPEVGSEAIVAIDCEPEAEVVVDCQPIVEPAEAT